MTVAINPNLFGWLTDFHAVDLDSRSGILGETHPQDANSVQMHLRSLGLVGFVDTGDCKDHYVHQAGFDLDGEYDTYIDLIRDRLPWAQVLPPRPGDTINATHPILPGNHDEEYDGSEVGHDGDYSRFNARFWGPPYHWVVEWAAAKVRFIGIHASIIHDGDPGAGGFYVAPAEVTWLAAEIAATPADWRIFVCCHAPLSSTFGNNITGTPQADLTALLAANNTKVKAFLFGHRHQYGASALEDGVRHICGGSMAYTLIGTGAPGSLGSFFILQYRSGTNDVVFHQRYGPGASLFGAVRRDAYVPVVVAL